MTTLLVKNISLLVTMDDHRREIPDGGLFCRDGFIEKVGLLNELPDQADEVLDLSGYLVVPGFINTHHHFYQTLTRALPGTQDVNLFQWLKTLYPIWARITPEDIRVSTQTALAELALTGCTTASDHLYLFPNGSLLDDEIEAAREVGIRLHASRGSMSLGVSKGGLPPDQIVEEEDAILKDSQRVIETYHNPNPGAMVQVVLAPCSPFSVSSELMRQSANLAREYGVRLHTHLAETIDEEDFCQDWFGLTPVELMESLGWTGDDVWFAHCVHIGKQGVRSFKESGSGIAHCPTSNMRLASGIAPITDYLRAGIKVGLGVDGSASNDGSHMLGEARQAMLLARVRSGLMGASRSNDEAPPLLTAREALALASQGGAKVLGRPDLGSLEAGKAADFAAFRLNRLEYAGALQDPVAALLFCSPVMADYTVVHGRVVVKDARLQTIDVDELIDKHNQAAKRIFNSP